MLNRNDWDAVYCNQQKLLQAVSNIDEIFLGGGTAIQCYTLPQKYRESEDLDFFTENVLGVKESARITQLLVSSIQKIKGIDVDYIRTEHGTHRITCDFEGNDEIIKVELLDFTAGRFLDLNFVSHYDFPRIENNYNLLLYKLKALCDRTDTIKDLFDIYFLFKELGSVNTKTLFLNLKLKFEASTGYIYDEKFVLSALQIKHRKWDIIPAPSLEKVWHGVTEAIETFRIEFIEDLSTEGLLELNFSYDTYVTKKANEIGCSGEDYVELFESNKFIEMEIRKDPIKLISNIQNLDKLIETSKTTQPIITEFDENNDKVKTSLDKKNLADTPPKI